MLSRALFDMLVQYVAAPDSDEWTTYWQLYELYAQLQASEWRVPEASVSGRTRKKAESKEEHDKRLQGYAEMERTRRQRYDAPVVYDSDEDKDERDEKEQLMAEELVELLEECEDVKAEADKENRPPDAARCFPWDSECTAVQQMAAEAEQRRRQRSCG